MKSHCLHWVLMSIRIYFCPRISSTQDWKYREKPADLLSPCIIRLDSILWDLMVQLLSNLISIIESSMMMNLRIMNRYSIGSLLINSCCTKDNQEVWVKEFLVVFLEEANKMNQDLRQMSRKQDISKGRWMSIMSRTELPMMLKPTKNSSCWKAWLCKCIWKNMELNWNSN